MHQPRKLRIAMSMIVCFLLQAQGADKYTDENRPYEFGFKIDGQQHRHESKDKDGIIMGEFGFITADDVYHVTVYATDKEGRFKILSMKNIHLKSSSAASSGSTRQGHSLTLPAQAPPAQALPAQAPPAQATPTQQGPPAPQSAKPFESVSLEPPGRSCSSCSLPTTTRRPPPPAPPASNQAYGNNDYNNPSLGAPESSPQNQQAFLPLSPGQQNNQQAGGQLQGSQGGQQSYPAGQPNYPQQVSGVSQNYPQQEPSVQNGPQTNSQQPGQSASNFPGLPSNTLETSGPSGPYNYGQLGAVPSAGQVQGGAGQAVGPLTYTGGQNNLPGPNGPVGSILQSGQANPQQGVVSGPNASPLGQSSYPQEGTSGPNAQSPEQSSYPQGGLFAPNAHGRTSKQYNGPEQQFNSNAGPNGPQGPGSAPGGQLGSVKPTLVSAQMQIVDKNTDIHALRPGEKAGLPPGLKKDDMTQLLYTFNYTVGFHGQFEEGYTNGVKKGYYFVTGRNGVRTRVDYVADDTGFHPKISQDILDLLSDDVPKPETERDAKYGLKGYEFKWLYYPVDSKRR